MNFQNWLSDLDAYSVGQQLKGVQLDTRRAMVEGLLGAPLPAFYRSFVEVAGGFAVPSDSHPDELKHKVSVIYGFIPGDAYDLSENLDALREHIPEKHLPFAGDGGGSAFLLDVGSGNVSFWEHETGELTSLAPDFDSFLRSLSG